MEVWVEDVFQDNVDTIVTLKGEELKVQEQDVKYAVEFDLKSLSNATQKTYGLLVQRDEARRNGTAERDLPNQ